MKNFYFYLATVLANVGICGAWFLGAIRFAAWCSPESRTREEEFFTRMQTPVWTDRTNRNAIGGNACCSAISAWSIAAALCSCH